MHRARRQGTVRTAYGGKQTQAQPTFSEAAAAYRERRSREVSEGERSRTSWRNERIALRRLEHDLGTLLLIELGRADIEAFRFSRRRAGVKGATVNRDLACLSQVLEHSIELGWLSENPTRLVSRFSERPNVWKWLRPHEARDLLSSCADKHAPRYLAPLVLTALYTGMRRGELLGLQWRSVDLIDRTLEVES